jgi:hypothetical protein
MASDEVRIALERDEAIVLFEFLARAVDEGNGLAFRSSVEDDAEVWALNAVLILLEQALAEPFAPGFEKKLTAARKAIAERSGPWPWDSMPDEE